MLRLAIRVSANDAELVLAELIELAPSGIEEVEVDGYVEYAIYGAPGEIPSLPQLEVAVGDALVSVSTTEVEDGWEDRWREFHRPLIIGQELRVRPPWEARGDERLDVVIDPGRAFGTGAHATTSLCLEFLLDETPSGSLIDLGCGSGVIAILAAMLGFDPVCALDNDQLAVDATLENAEANSVRIETKRFDLREGHLDASDILVANILAPVLKVLPEKLSAERPRRVILSGLLESESLPMASHWRDFGYELREAKTRDGWAAIALDLQ